MGALEKGHPPTADTPQQPEAEINESDETLKYHLLGPSLTKAGQETVDQQKVSEVIYEASKGSKFFNHEKVRDQALTEKIQRILAQKEKLERQDLSAYVRRADEYIAELELGRDLSQCIVHLDCDAFFAAVEELDRPELRHVPMAVGRGVLTTCNYVARKYGCRSGMASFVAKKLCPQLICLPQNYEKYTAKAKEIRAIIANYDPRFESASIDEAYLNITDYCMANNMEPHDAVQKLRNEISAETKVTVSAGIAANAKIAKIASNWNKPNGQFYIPSERTAIMNFMAKIPVRKVNGVGRVFERELDAIGIKTCRDIYPLRGMLFPLFGHKAFQFLMQCYLGLGRTNIAPAEERQRKSVGTESTFRDLEGLANLQAKLKSTATELEKDLRKTECKGRTLVLKVKLHTFEVISRQAVTPKPVYLADDLYNYALPLLTKINKETPNLKIRLMGLRCTNLISTKKPDVNFFDVKGTSSHGSSTAELNAASRGAVALTEEEFETAAFEERADEIETLERLSQELESSRQEKAELKACAVSETWMCPVCSYPQPADDKAFNQHVDFCLSKNMIKEAVNGTLVDNASPPVTKRKTAPGDPPERESQSRNVIQQDQLYPRLSLSSSKTTMRSLDKQHNPTNKPFTPSMSAAFKKTTKAPLTPKVAGYQSSHLNRKLNRADSPVAGLSHTAEKLSRTNTTVNANITPRSGSRSSRRDVVSSSPSGTPSSTQPCSRLPHPPERHPAESNLSPRDNNGLPTRSSRPASVVNGAVHNVSLSRPDSSCSNTRGNPMFFHADDARSPSSSYDADMKQCHGPAQSNNQPFIYANGVADESRNLSDISRKSGSANNKRQKPGHSAILPRSPVVSPRLQNIQPTSSPRELAFTTRDSNRANVQSVHPQESIGPQTRLSPTLRDIRRQCSHGKSPSVDGSYCFRQARPPLVSPPSLPALLAGDRSSSSSPNHSPLPSSNRSSTTGDILQPFPRIGSPSKEDANPNSQRLNELATNARTERKVLDLEISNSSLLAINRALEREMKKQNAELRRYRRLSRTGRLSVTSSHRSVSGGGLSIVSETDGAISEESFHYIPSDSDDNASSWDEEAASPSESAESEHHHCPRDEKYVLDDLAKHQQLLIDSQKLNQSIRRCLGWTESLIMEGKKALEYQVRVSEIEIGGRVLARDDAGGDWEGSRGLLSPTTEIPKFLDEHSITDHAVLAEFALSDGDDNNEQTH
ncbi:DNA polymerase IV [Emydomyces testavorans]|uniref:DNA polymerase kappa n=1 Tax=Emydomyces testavorans TaxID=2070801 RepID=A0AAF0DL35_9EURO|nr:DNA polymerase IV [Emydomyces testavorans]